jgi:hypothetical protein
VDSVAVLGINFLWRKFVAKKKHSINWEDDAAVSFEVNGMQYESIEDVPDEKDRLKLEAMMDSASNTEFDAEFAAMDQQAQPTSNVSPEKIIVGVFTGVAVLMLLIAGIASVNNILKINREESAPGMVVDMTKRLEYDENDSDRVIGEAYFPVVEFTARDGKRRQVQLSEGSFPPSYEVGEKVVVLYEPDHPLTARIKSAGSSALLWILPGITGVLGLAFLGAVVVVQRFLLKDDSKP